MALAIRVGTTKFNPFADETIIASQDYMTLNITNNTITPLQFASFGFEYGASVKKSDTTGLSSAAQLFYSVNPLQPSYC